jgi:hypothetical protein
MTSEITIENSAEQRAPREFLLSKDPNKAMQDMMDTIDALRQVFVKENEALANADTKRFLALQDEKVAAAKRYQKGSEQFLARREELKTANPDKLVAFEDLYESFSETTRENLTQLSRMKKGMSRLHDHVMKAARDSADKDGVNYSAHGQLKSHTRSLSMGLNESA